MAVFGYIKVNEGELKVRDYRLYRAVYCGLCKTLKKRIGWTSPLSLSYDFVFLAIVCADVGNEGFEITSGRCGLHPFKKRPVAKENRALDYAAASSAILKYYKLRDDLADSGFFKKFAVRFLLPSAKRQMKRAVKAFPEFELASLAENISSSLSELSKLEKAGSPSCERNADVFGILLSNVIKNYFHATPNAENAENLGYFVGSLIYIADACDDFAQDKKSGSYNPLISAGLDEIPEILVTATAAKLNENAVNALNALPSRFGDLRRISENILTLGIPAVFEKILKRKEK